MTIECPDCGTVFKTASCKCGYKPPARPKEWTPRTLPAPRGWDIEKNQWQAKAALLADLKVAGPRRWAHAILHLHKNGIQQHPSSIRLAQEAIKTAAPE